MTAAFRETVRMKRNRVTPLGDIIATPLRGAWMGNRGILHRGTDIVSFHRGHLWITCALQYRDWRAAQWAPRHYTVLFFHDEAVALAAGHRPCALCRRAAYREFRIGATGGSALPSAQELDRRLHAERLVQGTHRRRLHTRSWPELPDGSFVVVDQRPSLVLGDAVVRWTEHGYRPAVRRPAAGQVEVITPPASIAALTAGYPVQIHSTARQLAQGLGRVASPPTLAIDRSPHIDRGPSGQDLLGGRDGSNAAIRGT